MTLIGCTSMNSWCTMPMPSRDRIGFGSAMFDGRAVDPGCVPRRPCRGRRESASGALAGPVLAEQRVDLAMRFTAKSTLSLATTLPKRLTMPLHCDERRGSRS